jgi:tetratricopeptide (TPR) repeat protein
MGHTILGQLMEKTGRLEKAEDEYKLALPLYEKLVNGPPANPDYAEDLGACLMNLSIVLAKTKRPRDAEVGYGRAQKALEQVAADRRSHPEYRMRQAALFTNLGTLLANTRRTQAAIESYQRAFDTWKALVVEFPNVPRYRTSHIMNCLNLGQARQHANDRNGALAAYKEGLEAARALGNDFPTRLSEVNTWAGRILDQLGYLYGKMGMAPEAVSSYEQLLKLQPKNARACSYLAYILVRVRDPKVYNPEEAIKLAKTATRLAPQEPMGWISLGMACYRRQKWADARKALEQGLKVGVPGANGLFYLAMAHWQLGDKKEARRCYEEGITWMRRHGQKEHPRRIEAAQLLDIKNAPTAKDKSPQQ